MKTSIQNESIENILAEMNRMYEAFNKEFFSGKLPGVNFQLILRDKRKSFTKRGGIDIIFVSAVMIRLGNVDDIVKHILHQMVHLECQRTGIKALTRQERYHNIKFKEVAAEHGIPIGERDIELGYYEVELTDELRKRCEPYVYPKKWQVLIDSVDMFSVDFTYYKVYICDGCGRTLLAPGGACIVCGTCLTNYRQVYRKRG